MPTTTPLNVLDELYLHLNREDEPWSVHVEIRVDGSIDMARLEAAVREAAGRHPLARAQLAPSRATALHYEWIIADELAGIDLREMTCRDPEDLDRAREQLLNRVPSLDRPGPFSLLLAHTGDGDVIVLNMHHAAADGLSALRLLGSIARAYAREDDPVPELDPLEVRNVSALASPGSAKERLDRGRAGLDYLSRGVSTPTRIAPQGANPQPGYGFSFLTFQASEVQRLFALRSQGATINDVLPQRDHLPDDADVVDTAVLSNLGRIDSVPHLGEAGSVRELWFSPPGRMPLGASLGAATLDGRLFLTLRHRHALLDPTAANQFLATFKRELLGDTELRFAMLSI